MRDKLVKLVKRLLEDSIYGESTEYYKETIRELEELLEDYEN